MKLYDAPRTCSLSPHIVLHELALPFERILVDNRTKKTADGRDFLTINPKGYVAALELDDGRVLTEGAVIVQYLADLRPEQGLAPPAATWERVRLQEWLNFVTCEIHAGLAPLFNRALAETAGGHFVERLRRRLDYLQPILAERRYLMESGYSVADIYLFTVLRWCPLFSIDLNPWPALKRYLERVGERPAVRAALRGEAAS
ncbi:Glutathione S-transferase domain protein [Alloalcanivorax dieselolei B5]|uniref:Glutathione S-transferase domain protein n=1 Tax=Alcanivorax dieselolei (strain DSM 16502 / CGMCC 1.3690 / MCCC 1A00001 / B-5) TaxID=930169 RepID=K0CGE6_ALCDB|nr:glutathione transferase GstA [Alloalcanivorax dieselolei]AFT70696.1 Glutathione S-transferase domain protein [Alloalcanivorax dieselolei B5]GGJ97031.1 glutathione S-transferase [Alloalcanivorax dieselolei]